jgi:3',5'-cyclic AMP phosphodiesterase CpdA
MGNILTILIFLLFVVFVVLLIKGRRFDSGVPVYLLKMNHEEKPYRCRTLTFGRAGTNKPDHLKISHPSVSRIQGYITYREAESDGYQEGRFELYREKDAMQTLIVRHPNSERQQVLNVENSPIPLQNGDIIHIGEVKMEFILERERSR